MECLIECPECGVTFDGQWPELDGQDVTDAPVTEQECPAGHKFEAEYPGWSFYTEAG